MTKTKKLTFSAILTALAFILMMISKILPAPWLQGGSITLASMVPIILISILLGTKWGIISGLVYSFLQMMTGFYPPPASTFLSFTAVVLLDYIFAFTCLGLAGLFVKILHHKIWAIPVSGMIVTTIRYVMHILSGILIWGVYAEGQSVLVYSLLYNASYMIPEIIITTTVLSILAPKIARA